MTLVTSKETIELPISFVQRLRRIASSTHRTVEDVLTATFDSALPREDSLEPALADELAAMQLFSDEKLRSSVQSSVTASQEARLMQLTDAQDTRLLTESEESELAELLTAIDRSMLVRARALSLLKLRGHSIDEFIDPAQFIPA